MGRNRAFALGAVALVMVVGAAAWRFAFFIAPFAWTSEPQRLARVLRIESGMRVADIGAGSGALALAIAPIVGGHGQVFATELNPDRRREIERRVSRAAATNVRVIAAGEADTRLPDACCDVVYMRAVFHHIDDRPPFAADVRRALAPGGRLGVIDFAPGRLWFLGPHHGVRAEEVETVFLRAGLRLRERLDDWGGGMFLVVLERDAR